MLQERVSNHPSLLSATIILMLAFILATTGCGDGGGRVATAQEVDSDAIVDAQARQMLIDGRQIFRFDTFGDEVFWGGTLQLHQAIAGVQGGGVGPGLSPVAALGLGLKVDVDALPPELISGLTQGTVDLNNPANTLELLKLNAVLGVTGFFDAGGSTLQSVGIQCALCHSTVDDSFAPGIGRRLDGWANRDLNVGAIIAFAPNLQFFVDLLGVADQATVRAVLNGWGPGKFDAELLLDGKAVNPQQVTNGVVTGANVPAATLLPPIFGLAGVNLHTWTGWGSVTHWNAFVANLEMGGQGTFFDPRLNDAVRFPVAARAGLGNLRDAQDLITSKLAELHFYQLALPAPSPPAGSFDPAAAGRGQALFSGKAQCATCHVPPIYTESGWNMHTPAEMGIDAFQADRSPDGRYRTAPLKGLWTHTKGGFYHDGRFATLRDVVLHYNAFLGLALTEPEIIDLIEFLKSL
jgi:hypothetical protein